MATSSVVALDRLFYPPLGGRNAATGRRFESFL
jgi:hypothetical protein